MSEPSSNGLFLPRWWAFLAAFLFGALLQTLLIAYSGVPWTREWAFLGLLGACGLMASWILTALLWPLSEGGRVLFQFVFLGLWASFGLGVLTIAREAQWKVDTALVEKINDARVALRQQAIERAKQALDERVQREERIKEDRFARYEGQVDVTTLDRMRSLDAEILGELRAAAEKYETVVAANAVDGPSSWLRVATLDELEERRARNQAIYEASRAYNDFLDGLEGRYAKRLEALSLEPPADRFALAEMERLLQFWEHSGAREFRRLDAEICGLALQAMDVLREHWGTWRFDRADSRVVFEQTNVEFRFLQILKEAEMLARKQMAIERELSQAEG